MSNNTPSGPVQQRGMLLLQCPLVKIGQYHITSKLFIFRFLTLSSRMQRTHRAKPDIYFTPPPLIINLHFCWKQERSFSKIIKQTQPDNPNEAFYGKRGEKGGKVGKLKTDEEDRRQERREATSMACAVTPCSLRILLSPAITKKNFISILCMHTKMFLNKLLKTFIHQIRKSVKETFELLKVER